MNYKKIPTRCLTGKSWMIDTHVIDRPEFEDLFQMYQLGWVYLQTPDTVFNELKTRKDARHRDELLTARQAFPMPMGPFVIGRSSLGYAVLGSDADQKQLEKIHSVLWNGRIFSEDCQKADEGNGAAESKVGDTMIIQTTMRYAKEALITNDREILEGVSRIRQHVGNFQAWSVKDATLIAFDACKRIRIVREAQPDRVWDEDLPNWP